MVSEQQKKIFSKSQRKIFWLIANIRTYEGKDQDDKPRYTSWWARFVGEAYEDALDLEDKDRIIIQFGIVDNVYNKEKEKLYVTVTLFRFENDEEATSWSKATQRLPFDASKCCIGKQGLRIKGNMQQVWSKWVIMLKWRRRE